jgi:hypothetical protein
MMRPNITKFAASRGVGAIIVAVILQEQDSRQPSHSEYNTSPAYSILKGVLLSGEKLDQSRLAHPKISRDPQRIAVVNRNHWRYLTAWPTCATILTSMSRDDIDDQFEDVHVERLNSTMKMIATASEGM